MIRVENLSKNFRGLKAVNDVNFEIEEGKISGLIGPNGAGKTTTFNMISGTYNPSRGKVYFKGQDITCLKPHQYTQIGMARTFQITKPLMNMSVIDNVIAGAFFGRNKCKTLAEARAYALETMEITGLTGKKDFLAKELGTPDRKKLELTRALVAKPTILLLDEVMAGLNPTETDECVELIKKINKSGVTVFLIEHVMRAVVSLCEKIIVLHHGEKVAEGTPEVVMNDPHVIEIYLGKEEQDAYS